MKLAHIPDRSETLTEREQEILACLAQGLTNQEIANQLHLAEKTVRWYNSQIYSKLSVSNRAEAVEQAKALGLLAAPPDAPVIEGKHNLPAQATPFVGRQSELGELTILLNDGSTRLITILAPGGMGKTRLALEAARNQVGRYHHGVFFVPLAHLSSPDDIMTTIAENVGYGFYGSEPPKQQLLNYFRERHVLLVLDNFEHVLDGAPLVTDIIQTSPKVVVLTTSREKLNLSSETMFVLSGMPHPSWETPEDALEYDAVKLFMQSAHRVRPDFVLQPANLDYLARICRLTTGMPLALVLAASWIDMLTLEQIAAEIQQSLDILETDTRDVPERQRSVRASFNYSWGRLNAAEQVIFMKLSVFRGGFTAEAAQTVAGANLRELRKLVDKALVQTQPSGRYSVHELLRQYAAEQLYEIPGEKETTQGLHATFFTDLLHRLEEKLKGPQLTAALDEIDEELDNIRASWQWVIAQCNEGAIQKSLQSLALFYIMRSRRQDGDQAFGLLLPCLGAAENLLMAQVLMALASFKISRDHSAFTELVRNGLSIWRNLGSPAGVGFSLGYLTVRLLQVCGHDEIVPFCQKALAHAQENDDLWETAWLLYTLGDLILGSGNITEAVPLFQQSVDYFRSLGNRWALTFPLGGLEWAYANLGDHHQSRQLNQEGLSICREIGDREGIIWRCGRLANIAYFQRDTASAKFYLRELVQLALELQLDARIHEFSASLIINLLLEAGELTRAVELIAMLQTDLIKQADNTHHRTVAQEFKEQYERHLSTLETRLPAKAFVAARQYGETSNLRQSMAELADSFLVPDEERQQTSESVINTQTLVGQNLAESLTNREMEILRLIANGFSNRDIAAELIFSLGTVKWYVHQIHTKLDVGNRTQAVARARELKLLP